MHSLGLMIGCFALAFVAEAGPTIVDFTQPTGARIRALNGGNLGPAIVNAQIFGTGVDDFKALRVPLVRTHDAALGNAGMRLGDLQFIFPIFKNDPNDPDNYYFRETDDYLKRIKDCGADVLFRLGTSIEHSGGKYAIRPPEDPEKWADVCVNVIRHYNEGWANGPKFGIRYWEIWNEPDGGSNWTGTALDYCRLYEVTARKIKARFPDVKVGGPALAYFNPNATNDCPWAKFAHEFLAYCRDRKVPMDFFSWHLYSRDVQSTVDSPKFVRRVLDKYGFDKTELVLDEWHYRWTSFRRCGQDLTNGLRSANAAVYATAVLTGWQDEPIDQACYYTIGPLWNCWGAVDEQNSRLKGFYTFRMFAAMLDYPERVVVTPGDPNVWVLAGRSAEGRRALLVSNYKSGLKTVDLILRGAEGKAFACTAFTEDQNEAHSDVSVAADGRLVLPGAKPGFSSAYLLTEKAD